MKEKEFATPNDVLLTKKGKWYLKGRELKKEEIDNLRGEAQLIASTSLWKLLVNEGKYHAQKRATMDANTGDDTKDLATLRDAQAYHKVVTMFERFINSFT